MITSSMWAAAIFFAGYIFGVASASSKALKRPACVCSAAAPLPRPTRGEIILIGGGPGAPELLTLAGLSALRSADVVISDLIASKELRAMAPPGAVFHVAEKVPGNADTAQAWVNATGLEA